MLLPSAFSLSCDSNTAPSRLTTTTTTTIFTTAPLSPSLSPSSAFPTLYSTCRALQSMLTSPNQLPSPPPSTHAALPSPHIHSSPFKLRLRPRKDDAPRATTTPTTARPIAECPRTPPRRRIVKRAQAVNVPLPPPPPPPLLPAPSPPRGINKRRRGEDGGENALVADGPQRGDITAPRCRNIDEGDEARIYLSQCDEPSSAPHDKNSDDYSRANGKAASPSRSRSRSRSHSHSHSHSHSLPSTPKRLRRGPETLPFGLARSDFRSLQLPRARGPKVGLDDSHHSSSQELDFDVWTTDDDRVLVELVLEKLRLSKSEWQDCARSLGRDRRAVGRRWRSLLERGEVGLKSKSIGGGGGGGGGGGEGPGPGGVSGCGSGSGSGSGSGRSKGKTGRRAGIHGSWR